MTTENYIDGGSYVGPQAVEVFRARVLYSSLGLFHKTGMKPTRGVGLRRMMELASEMTGKNFPASRKAIPAALESLRLVILASEAALRVS